MALVIKFLIASTSVSTEAIAPTPTSPHASVLATGGTTTAPICVIIASCCAVNGFSHITVFIAGASSSGRR